MHVELYETLEVSTDATQEQIKKSYRRLALIHHPDKGGDEATFKKIKNAYDILKDPEKRSMYDRFGLQEDGGSPMPDIFSNIFGGGLGNIFNMFTNSQVQKSKPIVYTREVSLDELCTRKVIKIKVNRDSVCPCRQEKFNRNQCSSCGGRGSIVKDNGPFKMISGCPHCGGQGFTIPFCKDCKKGMTEDSKIFNIYLTPEMGDNYQYNFPGEGNQYIGELRGDFIVCIKHKKHPQFKVHSGHLVYERRTSLREALCGYSSIILHPNGESINLEFPGVIGPNCKKVIDGKGMISTHDLIVHHDIYFPESLTEEQVRSLGKILN